MICCSRAVDAGQDTRHAFQFFFFSLCRCLCFDGYARAIRSPPTAMPKICCRIVYHDEYYRCVPFRLGALGSFHGLHPLLARIEAVVTAMPARRWRDARCCRHPLIWRDMSAHGGGCRARGRRPRASRAADGAMLRSDAFCFADIRHARHCRCCADDAIKRKHDVFFLRAMLCATRHECRLS